MSIALTRASQLLTLAGSPLPRSGNASRELGILAQASLVIADDHIAWVGPHS